MKKYNFLVFIGRFQPFHNGHSAIVQAGLKLTDQLIILCGSAHQPRTIRNPWTVAEREQMIRGAVSVHDQARLHVMPLMDSLYNDDAWVNNVQTTVQGLIAAHYQKPHQDPVIGLIGHNKDQSSYYLSLFPQWQAVSVQNLAGISATPLRNAFLNTGKIDAVVPDNVYQQLMQFKQTHAYIALKDEQAFVRQYQQAWQAAPYAPTFVTVDAVVVQSGHVLLVERKARPGKGLLALPGGFVNQDETLFDACVRELREETRLKVPVPVLKGSIQTQQIFDDPHRSARGRTMTYAFHMALPADEKLPKVKGGDDARHALWVPLSELDPQRLFEDHYFIIQRMLGLSTTTHRDRPDDKSTNEGISL